MDAHFTTPLARRVSIEFALFFIAFSTPQPGLAWVQEGHEDTALIAERNTTEPAKAKGSDNSNSHSKVSQQETVNKQGQSKPTTVPCPPTTAIVSVPASWWERFYVIFTGLLVGIGVIGAYLALRTLRAIEEQARSARSSAETAKESALAAKASANAAALNAQAVIDAERAWILVKNVGNPEGWYVPTKPDYLPGMVFEFEVYGKTPARVMDAIFHLENVTAKLGVKPSEPDIPPLPEYKSAGRSPEFPEGGRIMPSGQKFKSGWALFSR